MRKYLAPLFFLPVLPLLYSCSNKPGNHTSPTGYQLQEPVKKMLPDALLEISGICFGPNGGDSLFAVNDEDGVLFAIDTAKQHKTYNRYRFGKSGDYEDLAYYRGRWVILKSNGTLIQLAGLPQGDTDSLQTSKDLLPKGEYEAMAAAADTLFVLCKNCDADKGNGTTTVYALTESGGRLAVVQQKSISTADINGTEAFRPSAMALNPVSGSWMVVSAVNKILVELNRSFAVTGVHRLKHSLFPQPEGLTFDAAGNLYISNEGDEKNASLLFFRYSP